MYNFIFDINKCVGCQACAVACSLENKTELPIFWRNVNTFNQFKHPEIQVFHNSLACNHCKEPLCMKNCPASAYTRNNVTGIISHDAKKCIGCKYCTWACPYDAPKFNDKTKVIEKCTFCNHRIENGLKPACANLCPTGALDFEISSQKNDFEQITGFTDIGISPAINFVTLRKDEPPKFSLVQDTENFNFENQKTDKKISAKNEISLIIFTLLTALLTGLYTSEIFGGFKLNHLMFLEIGVFGMLLSAIHLGKKLRAFRAVFNIGTSWLSREIFFYTIFIALASLNFFVFDNNIIISYITAFLGFATLFSIDMVYNIAIQKKGLVLNSSNVFFTGILFWGLFTQNPVIYLSIGCLKTVLYIIKNFEEFKSFKLSKSLLLKSLRLDLLISFPFIFWLINWDSLYLVTVLSIFLGEVIDRIEYYNELQIITPNMQMQNDFKKQIS